MVSGCAVRWVRLRDWDESFSIDGELVERQEKQSSHSAVLSCVCCVDRPKAVSFAVEISFVSNPRTGRVEEMPHHSRA